MGFLQSLFGKQKAVGSSSKKALPVSGGHVESDEPLRCPKCGDAKRDTTPRYAVFVCNKCGVTVTIDNYIVR